MNFPSRLYTLDLARGVAAFTVVLWHWQHFFYKPYALPQNFAFDAQPLYKGLLGSLYEIGGHIAVPFFFLLSGFVFFWLYQEKIANRSCSVKEFAILRFARLYPLHIVTLGIVAVLQLAYLSLTSHYFVESHNDWYHFLLHLIFASNWGVEKGDSFNSPVWSVSIEIGLYSIFFLIAFLRIAGWRSLLVIVFALIVLQELQFGGKVGGRWLNALDAFFAGGLTFYALSWYIKRRSRAIDRFIIYSAITLWVSIMISKAIEHLILGHYNVYVLGLFPLTISALVLLECSGGSVPKRLRWIGDITYSVYLIHFPLQLIFMTIARCIGLDSSIFYSPWTLLLFLILLVPLSLVTFHFFERPMQSLIRKRLLK